MQAAGQVRKSPVGGFAAVLALALMLAMTGIGCGSDDDTTAADKGADSTASGASAEEQIKATYRQIDESLRGKDYQQACDLMTPAMQDQAATGGQDCAASFEALLANNKPSKTSLKLSSIKIQGNKAKASAKSKDTLAAVPIEFTKQGDTWLISGPLAK